MQLKNRFFIGCLIGLGLLGISYYVLYPHAHSFWKKKFKNYVQEQFIDSIQLKTTRSIPHDADLGSYLAGYFAQNDRNYHYAAHYFEKVLQKDENYHELKQSLLMYYLLTGQIDKAVLLIPQPIQASESTLLSTPVIIADFFNKKEYQKVLDFLKAKKSSHSDIYATPLLSAWAYAGLNKEKEAFDALNTLPTKEFQNVYNYHKILLLIYFGKKEEALSLYQNTQENQIYSIHMILSLFDVLPPDNPSLSEKLLDKLVIPFFHNNLQAYHIYKNLNLKSISTPQEAVSHIYQIFSLYFYQNDMPEITLSLNNIALYLSPDSNLMKLLVAESYDAIDMYDYEGKTLNSIDSESMLILSKIALNHMKLNNFSKAIDMFQTLLQHSPNDSFLHLYIAQSYVSLYQYEKALEHLNQAYDLMAQQQRIPELVEILVWRSTAYDGLNQPNKALDSLYEAHRYNPRDISVLNALGYLLIDYDIDVQKGLRFVLQAHQIIPDDGPILDSLSWGYYKAGDYQKALKYAEKALKQIPSNAVMYMHLGDIYMALNRKQDAISAYQKALKAKQDKTPKIETQIKQKLASFQESEDTENKEEKE